MIQNLNRIFVVVSNGCWLIKSTTATHLFDVLLTIGDRERDRDVADGRSVDRLSKWNFFVSSVNYINTSIAWNAASAFV